MSSFILPAKGKYLEVMKDEGLQAGIAAVVSDAIADLESAVYEELHYEDNVDLYNEAVSFLGGYEVHLMCDIDSEYGRMYPTEVFETFGSDFDFSDSFYLDDMTTGSDLLDMMMDEGNDCNDIATAIYNGDIYDSTTKYMDTVVLEAHQMIEYLEKEANKVNRAKEIFDSLVTFENADILVNAVWQAMQE